MLMAKTMFRKHPSRNMAAHILHHECPGMNFYGSRDVNILLQIRSHLQTVFSAHILVYTVHQVCVF